MKNEYYSQIIKGVTNDLKEIWNDFCRSTSRIVSLSSQVFHTLRELRKGRCDLFSGVKRLSILIIGIIKNILITIGIIMFFMIFFIIPFILLKLER